MEFIKIEKNSLVTPGEYLLHVPSKEIVVCGAFLKNVGKIKALKSGRLIVEPIENFKKINISQKEKRNKKYKSCGGCKRK
jgi:hypothetical protein